MRMCLALALSAVIAVPALAQPPGGRGMMGMMGGVALTNASVQTELKLTDEQKTKIKEFSEKNLREMGEAMRGAAGDREKMQEIFTKMRESSEKFNKETLTADQAKRLKEITLQVGGVLGAVRNEEVSKALKFTDEQKEK